MTVNNVNNEMVTADRNMMELLQLSETVAKSKAAILIQGEAGTGKKLFAQWIHQKSQRLHKPLEIFNCAESAPSGQDSAFLSQLERAHGGTFLLLEVSKLSSPLQAKLLQVLQEGMFSKSQTNGQLYPIDVRIIATSTPSLSQVVKSGEFREDLFYRLNVVNLKIPPLAERLGDIELLAKGFSKKWGQIHGKGVLSISEEGIQRLNGHRWPGNVRELENTIERAVLFTTTNEIHARDIQIQNTTESAPLSLSQAIASAWKPGRTLNEIERNVIIEALKYHSGNRTHTAKALGISIRTLRNKLAEYRVLGIHL